MCVLVHYMQPNALYGEVFIYMSITPLYVFMYLYLHIFSFKESLSIPVNLTYFNCKTVQLSVAIVASFGMLTVYTDPITLIIYGGMHDACFSYNYYY